jgi:hypothetical protein
MLIALLIPFGVQAFLIILDEYVFHIKRSLPKWERIGHPIDTLSVVLCLSLVQLIPYSKEGLYGYIALAIFSCLLITKDEFVHKHHCLASEQWLHAVLFINHPILLTAIGLFWVCLSAEPVPVWLIPVSQHKAVMQSFLRMQTVFASVFMLYQIIYWNFIWKPKEEK